MEDGDSLLRLQGLQADLVAFAESRLPNLERLWAELEESIDDFRNLLDRQRRSDKSRKGLADEKITLGGDEYAINDDFRQQAIQVADGLDLDELEAAKLCILSQDRGLELQRTTAFAAMLRFHEQREALLTALRLCIRQAVGEDMEAEPRDVFLQLLRLITQGSDGAPSTNTNFVRKNISAMEEIEQWIRLLDNRLQGASIIGQTLGALDVEILDYERASLVRQHESLAVILCYLAKDGHAGVDDYRFLLAKAAAIETFDDVVIHYVPVFISFSSSIGMNAGAATFRDARSLDQTFADKTEKSSWKIADFRAIANVLWLAEYSSRYSDQPTGSPLQGVDIEKENDIRSERVMESLRNGAFQLLLLICAKVRAEQWHDPAKSGLVNFLTGEIMTTRNATITTSDYFQEMLAEQLQNFIDAFITNMPDTIRRLKFEEDEERRNMGPRLPQVHQEHTLHLERFLVVISYAFRGFPEAAMEAFWTDPDGNMYGFLQWASKRQSTPRVAAFCEMFQSISESGECADAAHKFLMDEAVGASSAKLRRGVSLSWAQVFAELGYYSNRLQDTPNVLNSHTDSGLASQTVEPESALMLECYLRLIGYLCQNSPAARDFVMSHQEFHLHEVLLDLAKSGIDDRFKACVFKTLASLLTDKTNERANVIWEAMDGWLYGIIQKPGAPRPTAPQTNSDDAAAPRLTPIARGFEQTNAFVRFVQALILPSSQPETLNDTLPFPEQLGLQYRMPGINDYVDFILGRIFRGLIAELPDLDQAWKLRCACLDFIALCLSTFNEDLVVFANATNINVDTAISTSSLVAYVRLHPFARVMEWLFNDGVISQLFAAAHDDIDTVSTSDSQSPRITAVCRSLEIVDLTLKLQTTYFDIIRPIIKTQSVARPRHVANPAFASFEDAVLGNLHIVVDLGLYCGTMHRELTVLSLALLQRLATSRKLTSAPPAVIGGRAGVSRMLSALQQDEDVDRINSALIGPLTLDPRELEIRETSPGLHIKQAILDLLNKSLDISLHRPGLAHSLLGFRCTEGAVTINPEGRFAAGASLFHAVARLYAEAVPLEEVTTSSWFSSICRSASEVIRKLLKSQLTSNIVLAELRESGYREAVALAQRPITATSLWSDKTCSDPEFLVTESAPAFRDFLVQRSAYYEHASLEFRSAKILGSQTIAEKTKAMLLGLTVLPTGEQIQNPSIFDLFDFIDLEMTAPFTVTTTRYMSGLDFSICRSDDQETGSVYDLRLVKELLLLRTAELQKENQLVDAANAQQCQEEADAILLCMVSENQAASIQKSQQEALKAWSQLIVIMLDTDQLEPTQKSAFVLQALQMVLPKADISLAQESPMTLSLMKLVYALVRAYSSVSIDASSKETGVAHERLLHAFKTALTGISSAVDSINLRETCYQIVRHFLKSASNNRGLGQATVARHATRTVEIAGERLVDIVCEDALSSSDSCKVAAIFTLESCCQLFQSVKSPYMVRSMTRLNFVAVLVDSIRSIASEFQSEASPADLDTIVATIQTSLALLLRLSQDQEGAAAILDAGIFSSVRDSQLFATDPDIGLDIENPDALENFYHLLVSILRVINSIVLVKGSRNQQVTAQGRNFLQENRQCMQAVFKATSRTDRMSEKTRQNLEDLVDNFTVLIAATDFLGVSPRF